MIVRTKSLKDCKKQWQGRKKHLRQPDSRNIHKGPYQIAQEERIQALIERVNADKAKGLW